MDNQGIDRKTETGPHPGLYLHLPFCSAICPYCDFSVLPGGSDMRARFVDDLVLELSACPSFDLPFDTIYLGGGTPSIFTPEQLERIVAAARDHLDVATDAHLSLEANPEDVGPAALDAWRALGVRTVSLGVQSFDPEALAFLGRRHDSGRARQSVEEALEAGFDVVSVDLIFGWPGQTSRQWQEDLESATALGPPHLSCYQLTIDGRTPFGFRRDRGRLREMGEEDQAELFLLTHEILAAAGYEAYEVSNFAASPTFRSRHNQKYWGHGPYLGVGPSAHSFDGDRRRWWNQRKVRPWSRALGAGETPIAAEEVLSDEALVLERLMLGLRCSEGVDLAAIRRRFDRDLRSANEELVGELVRAGLLVERADRWVPTRAGLAVADGLAPRFRIPPLSSRLGCLRSADEWAET